MRYLRLAIVPAAIEVCGFVSACSYHKTVETAPAPAVVETVPAPAPAVVQTVPVPVPATSNSTTTTTTTDNGIVEKQKTTTYTTLGY
jgi:hypothetical protein